MSPQCAKESVPAALIRRQSQLLTSESIRKLESSLHGVCSLYNCSNFWGCGRNSLSGKLNLVPEHRPHIKSCQICPRGGKTTTAVFFSAGKAPAGWLKGPAAGFGYKQKMRTHRQHNGCSVLHPGPPHGQTGCMDVLAWWGLPVGGLSWAHTKNYTIFRSR